MTATHIVLGATGSVGKALVRHLAQAGRNVIAVSRSLDESKKNNVLYKKIDVLDTASLAQIIVPESVVYYVVNSPFHQWEELAPKLDSVLSACSNKKVKFVYLDNMYGYENKSQLVEGDPLVSLTKKGKIRADLCQRVWLAHQAGSVMVTIARSSDFYGTGVNNATIGKMVVNGLIAKGRASVPVNVDVPHCFNYIEDIAANIITLADAENSWGESWHLPCAAPISIASWGDLFLKEINKTGAIRRMPGIVESILGFIFPAIKEYRELQYQYDNPVLVNDKKFRLAFPAVVTPHQDAIREMVRATANKADHFQATGQLGKPGEI